MTTYVKSALVYTMLACALFTACADIVEASGQNPARVLVIQSDEYESTQRTAKGVRQALETGDLEVEMKFFTIVPGEDEKAALLDEKAEFGPDVLVTIGSRSTRLAKSIIDDTPIVFASVLNPVTSGFVGSCQHPGELTTGASLDIAVDIQLEKFRQLVPTIRKIGALYSSRTAYIVEQARDWAASHSIELITCEVVKPSDLPGAVDSLTRSCDGIWAIPDELIYTPQSTKHILLESFRNRIPVMGFSPSFVRSGALFALSVDHKFIGLQAGLLVREILKGAYPGQLAVTTPEAPYLYINRNTAEKLRIDVNPDFYTVAKEVYE